MVGQQASVGYDDTPLQPDGKWRVHDVAPAAAGSRHARPVCLGPATQ